MKDKIKELVNKIDNIEFVGLDNIKLGSAAHLLFYEDVNKFGFIKTIKRMIRLAMDCEYSIEKDGTGGIIFLYSNANKNRKYVLKKIQNIANLCENKIVLKPDKKIYLYKISDIIFLQKWRKKLIESGFDKSTSNYLSVYFLYAYLNLRIIRKNLSGENIKLIVSVHDTRLIDSVVIQYYNNIGIKTCGLQHGEINKLDAEEEYCLSFSKYHCIYSEYTYEIIKNFIKKDEFYEKLGMPQLIDIQEKNNTDKTGVFGLFLNYYVFEKENIELIEFANKVSDIYNLKYILKLHPSLEQTKYTNLTNQKCIYIYKDDIKIDKLIQKIDFGIFNKSTMFFELICLNVPCLEYKNDDFDSVSLLQVDNLEKFNEYYDGNMTNKFLNEMEEIKRIIKPKGEIKDNYKSFLKKFEEN